MQNDVSAVLDTRELFSHSSAEGREMSLSSLKVFRFNVVAMICDITARLEVNHGPVNNLDKYEVKTCLHCTYTENGLSSQLGR